MTTGTPGAGGRRTPGTLRWGRGVVLASGVPALALVSTGPVAALAGPPAVLVWAVSALVGTAMTLSFAELVRRFQLPTGGIAPATALAFGPRHRALGGLAQWSYWLGWSPALAVNSVLAGEYLRAALLPGGPLWAAWAMAGALLALVTLIHLRGIGAGARVQAALLVAGVVAVGPLLAMPVLGGHVDLGRLTPFAPPGGWASWSGLAALAGAAFLAGWSAYGAEIALTYGGEYRRGADAVRCVLATAGVTAGTYILVPLVLLAALGVEGMAADPAVALGSLARATTGQAAALVLVALVLVLVLSLNTIAVGCSRLLYEMGRRADGPRFLGRLNRHGAPGNALVANLVVNLVLIALGVLINGGRPGPVSVGLLVSANVAYFVSLVLALVAAWVARQPGAASSGFLRLGLVLAGFNALLLGAAGFTWGWDNVGLGAVVLVATCLLLTPRGAPAAQVTVRGGFGEVPHPLQEGSGI